MLHRLKKISPYFLLLLVAGNLLLQFAAPFGQWFIRHQMLERLEAGELVSISISNEKITWLINRKEILTENGPFDVKSFRVIGNKTVFTGLYDVAEKELKKKTPGLLSKTNSPVGILLWGFFECCLAEQTGSTWAPVVSNYPVFSQKTVQICLAAIDHPPAPGAATQL